MRVQTLPLKEKKRHRAWTYTRGMSYCAVKKYLTPFWFLCFVCVCIYHTYSRSVMYLHTRSANERLLVQFQAETQIPFGGRKGIYTSTSAHNQQNYSSLQTNSDEDNINCPEFLYKRFIYWWKGQNDQGKISKTVECKQGILKSKNPWRSEKWRSEVKENE